MIVKRVWRESKRSAGGRYVTIRWREGWYLFGILPLYIRDTEVQTNEE